jgi:hypothetical protein
MWFMFYDNNHQFIINDMYTSFNGSSREDCIVRGPDGSCTESTARSAFNRWVSENREMQWMAEKLLAAK